MTPKPCAPHCGTLTPAPHHHDIFECHTDYTRKPWRCYCTPECRKAARPVDGETKTVAP